MDERFPPATEDEIREAGGICIICRDDMSEGRRLPCGHVFHFACLRLWLQQQQSCPTCRQDIPVEAPAPAPQPQAPAPVEQPQPGAGWAAPRQPEAAQPGAGAVQQPEAAQPPAQRLEDVLAAALRRLEHNLAAEEPQAPSGGARVWTARAGARRCGRRAAAAPPLRTVPAGEHVLALPDDGEYLRVGDGFILMSELDLLLDEAAAASAAAETGAASPPRSPAPVEPARAEVARLRAERSAQPQQPDVAAALGAAAAGGRRAARRRVAPGARGGADSELRECTTRCGSLGRLPSHPCRRGARCPATRADSRAGSRPRSRMPPGQAGKIPTAPPPCLRFSRSCSARVCPIRENRPREEPGVGLEVRRPALAEGQDV